MVVQTFEFQDEVGEVVLRVCKVKIVHLALFDREKKIGESQTIEKCCHWRWVWERDMPHIVCSV